MTTTIKGQDTSTLDAAPSIVKAAYDSGKRVYLVTTYEGGSTWHRTGTISRTGGIKPAYLVMARRNQIGSSDILTERDWEKLPGKDHGMTRVIAVQASDGTYHRPLSWEVIKPGKNRFED